jgi:mono/diheme cytochrome c family protein
VRIVTLLGAALLLAGCEKLMRDMYDDARVKPLQAPKVAAVPAGAVERVRGVAASTSSGRRGTEQERERLEAEAAKAIPYPLTPALLARGRERFEIYCVPCHSPLGDGDGLIARRGFPHPPSYHVERLRRAPDRHFYDVMTDGYGVMYSYADRIAPRDRWAIVAYIRALQLSQDAPTVVSARRPR